MSQSPPQPDQHPEPDPGPTLELYLDRRLKGPEKEAVEATLRARPDLRAQVRVQQELNASLARLFAPPEQGAAPIPMPAPAVRSGRGRRLFPLVAAAAAVAIGLGAYFAVFSGKSSPAAAPIPDRLGPLYRAEIASGFVPQTVCTTREEFGKWVYDYYGQAVYPDDAAEIELVGWDYGPAVSSNSGVLLARAGGKEVIVVVDRSVRDKRPLPPPADPSLRSFRQQIGSVVFYEVTPLDAPSVLPHLSQGPPPGS